MSCHVSSLLLKIAVGLRFGHSSCDDVVPPPVSLSWSTIFGSVGVNIRVWALVLGFGPPAVARTRSSEPSSVRALRHKVVQVLRNWPPGRPNRVPLAVDTPCDPYAAVADSWLAAWRPSPCASFLSLRSIGLSQNPLHRRKGTVCTATQSVLALVQECTPFERVHRCVLPAL